MKIKNYKPLYIMLSLTALCLLSACSGSKITLEVKECNYPDLPSQAAPLWVCGAEVEGVAISAVGSAKPSVAGFSFMEQQAAANGRVLLAQQIKADMQAQVKNDVASTTISDQETVTASSSVNIEQITAQSLAGTRILKKITSPTGYLYILVGFDKATYDTYLTSIARK